jgi:sugar (pentulose or hexulose) kinase
MNYLVIDIGTSGCRAAVVTGRGQIQSQSRCPVSIDQPRPSFAEIDTDRLWRLVQKVIKSEVERHPAITFDAIGVSAMLGYVFLDKAGDPLMPAITYADNRATAEIKKIRQLVPEEKFIALTGRKPSPLLLAPKIQWLKRHRPETTVKLSHIIGLKDDIVRRLTGNIQTDVAHLDYSGLFNVHKGQFEPDILDLLNIEPSLFAAPTPATAIAGTLSSEAAGRLNLASGTPVIAGSSDGTTAMYGAGILEGGIAVLVSGTTDVVMMRCESAPRNPIRALIVNSGMQPNTYLVGGPLGLSGGSLKYFERLLQSTVAGLEKEINDLPPASNGLLLFPGLTGERAPYWKECLTGAVIGLTPNHKREHFLRAVMEGCALRILKLLTFLSQNQLIPRALNVVGGGANSDVWNQIRSDVTGLEVRRLSITEATCLGTALFCQAGLDQSRSMQEVSGEWIKVAKRFKPDPERIRTYKKLALLFESGIETNSNLYQELDDFKRQINADNNL